jgi:hypothetical protein
MKTKEYIKLLADSSLDRLRLRFVLEKGEITDFMVQYESFIDGKWHDIVRYDMAHGFFHRDLMNGDGTSDKKRLNFISYEASVMFAEQDIKERWQWYKDNYLKAIGK